MKALKIFERDKIRPTQLWLLPKRIVDNNSEKNVITQALKQIERGAS